MNSLLEQKLENEKLFIFYRQYLLTNSSRNAIFSVVQYLQKFRIYLGANTPKLQYFCVIFILYHPIFYAITAYLPALIVLTHHVSLPVHLSDCPSVHLSICQTFNPSVKWFICPFLHWNVPPFIYPYVFPFVCLSMSVHPSIYEYVCLCPSVLIFV